MALDLNACCRRGKMGEKEVLFLPEGPQVPDRAKGESGHRGHLLESNWQGQGGLQYHKMGGPARQHEDARLLQDWPFGSCLLYSLLG